MRFNRFIPFSLIPVDPVNLGIKGKLVSAVCCFCVILVIAWVSQQLTISAAYPILVASMGASAVILFIIPNSPLAQPWPFVGGQLLSTVIGVACAQFFPNAAFASAYAVGGSVLAMLLFRCLHPPGAASALAPTLSGDSITTLGYGFTLMPVGLNVAIMLVLALIINRWILHHEYPIRPRASREKNINRNLIAESSQRTGISEQDLEQALHDMDTFLDVSSSDLSKLLSVAQKQSYKRFSGPITCGDIMNSNVISVEYGTDVEDAWKLMHRNKHNSLPVIDRSKRVIGIITWHDFFKYINVNADEMFKDKFSAFIRRTTDISTNKPESVGHIMTSPVIVLTQSTHIVDLIPLMTNKGYRQIPIINHENRLVGMVQQANLIAALYRQFEQLRQ